LRRTTALIIGAPLVAALLAVPAAHATPAAPAAPAAAPAKAPSGSQTVKVSLDTVAPSAPVKGDTLTIAGTVTNRGKATITDAQVDLRVGQRLTGRLSIDSAAKRSGYTPGIDPAPLGDDYAVRLAKLPSGISQDFKLSVPVGKLGLGGDGVYQIGVSLSGQTSRARYDQVLGIQRTFLPWQEEEHDTRTQLTYLWPLIAPAHVTAETGTDDEQTPVFADDGLAAELAPGGRLEQMVSLGSELPVTWVIDPDLLASVDAMARGYRVKSGDTTVAGKNQAVAKQWLAALEAAVSDDKVVALPFADPDLAAIAHRGKNVSGTLSHLQTATEVAGATVQTILHVKPSTDFAWPVDGAIDPAIVDVATSAGAHKVIARSDSLQETGGLSYTPTAARPIGGGTTAVVADARLSTAFEGDMSKAGNSTLAVQKFLAQTLALTDQDTDAERSIVVAPQRMPSVAQAQSMARALRALDDDRWTQPIGLVDAAEAKPDADATTTVPGSSQYPKKLRGRELPTQAFQDIKSTQVSLNKFQVILTYPERVVTPFGNAVNRSMSTSWRGKSLEAQQYRDSVRDYLQGLINEVQLISKSDVTLSGRSATIPVTVQNRLLQGVDHLVLRLKSDNATRLRLNDGGAVAEQPIRIAGGHSQSVKFDAAANVNGQVQMTAQLYTEDGTPYGEEMTFTVKVSELTPTVLLVLAGGLLLLVLAGIRMYTQRKRANAEAANGNDGDGPEGGSGDGGNGPEGANGNGSDEPEDTDGNDGDEPEHPSDPAPDTGPENRRASGPGEKVER